VTLTYERDLNRVKMRHGQLSSDHPLTLSHTHSSATAASEPQK